MSYLGRKGGEAPQPEGADRKKSFTEITHVVINCLYKFRKTVLQQKSQSVNTGSSSVSALRKLNTGEALRHLTPFSNPVGSYAALKHPAKARSLGSSCCVQVWVPKSAAESGPAS